MMEEIDGIGPLAARFDVFLIDQFGVLLDGQGAYPNAAAALSRLAGMGKRILLLSNSGRRSAPNEARLTRLGFDRAAYLNVLTSGEVAHQALSERIGRTIAPGARVLVHARDADQSGIAGLDLTPTDTADTADLILLAGSNADAITLGEYAEMLAAAAARAVPCLCTNPDMTMLTALGPRPGAGRIAALYAELGGPVEYIGKPHPLIFQVAAQRLDHPAPSRVVMIGDSPVHDVAGAHRAGYAAALVRTGIHDDLDAAALRAHCMAEGHVPDFILPRFDFT